ncbi:MAG: helix-hairpin-helix domain-containing protein [Streptococcus salivarius]
MVKIDPKSIGVGQYQHDVSQKKLSENLDFVVDTVVNQVGVNVNTASSTLLSHVSGLNKTISENIVAYREENGEIASRAEIKRSHVSVPRPSNKQLVSFVFQMPRISWIIQGSTQSLTQR